MVGLHLFHSSRFSTAPRCENGFGSVCVNLLPCVESSFCVSLDSIWESEHAHNCGGLEAEQIEFNLDSEYSSSAAKVPRAEPHSDKNKVRGTQTISGFQDPFNREIVSGLMNRFVLFATLGFEESCLK